MGFMQADPKKLAKKINYIFADDELLKTALRHRSIGKDSNERLEFLGDAILNFTIAAELFARYPQQREGELSRLRSNLVNEESLAALATNFELGDYLQMGVGERKSGGHHRASILADALEAIIGAIYLDRGIDTCVKTVLPWYEKRFSEITTESLKDYKTKLQEYLQAGKLELPKYEIISTTGEMHEQTFYVTCKIAALNLVTEGIGSTKQKAEQDAANKAMQQILESKS